MPRTAITVNNLGDFSAATTVTQTSGDAANDHTIDATKTPNLMLRAENTNGGAAVAFTLELAAGGRSSYGQSLSISYSVPACGFVSKR
jgi:hypothetical protein